MTVRASDLQLLFSRLTWPSGLVRERAAAAIGAELLRNPSVIEALLDWIEAQELESTAALGLLPLVWAQAQDGTVRLPSAGELIDRIRRPSLLSLLLAKHIAGGEKLAAEPSLQHLDTSPTDLPPNTFFRKHMTSALPPIYENWARRIEEHWHIPFTRQWQFEWEHLYTRLGRKPSGRAFGFHGRPDDEHYAVIDFIASEVYRSAYLRTLAWAVTTKSLDLGSAEGLAAETCPLDLDLWRLSPRHRPKCWPEAPEQATEGKIITGPQNLWKTVETLLTTGNQNSEWRPGHVSGRIGAGDTIYDLEVRAILQSCEGPELPEPETVWEAIQSLPPIRRTHASQLGINGTVSSGRKPREVHVLGDWSVIQAVVFMRPQGIPRWQPWRIQRGVWIPIPYLYPLEVYVASESLEIRHGAKVVATWSDWTDHFTEMYTANAPSSTGSLLWLRKDFINELERSTKHRFCWVARLTGYARSNSYRQFETIEMYRYFGHSQLILPP